ncbi:MAG: hypothetical protein COA88_08965 [Kordia sp.]|nr:MAG: hypothetical protein COA88_08965 [Kordia sp.]
MRPIQILIVTNDDHYKNYLKSFLKNRISNIDIVASQTIKGILPYLKETSLFKLLILKPEINFTSDSMENILSLVKYDFNLKILLFQNNMKIRIAINNAGSIYYLKNNIKQFAHINTEEILDIFNPKKL